MDLTIKDVAELFNVSESTIRRWISDGKIPSYRMNQIHLDYRFSVTEMENWLMSHKLANTGSTSPFMAETKAVEAKKDKVKNTVGGSKAFSLFRALHKGDVLQAIPGQSKEEVIRATMKRTAKSLHLDAEVVTELLLGRENLMPTALNNGIGIPHARDIVLNTHQDVILVVYPETPLVNYGALDGKPVHTLFFLFASEDKQHLHLLAKIAHLSSQESALNFLKTKPNKEQFLDFIKQWESQISNPSS